MTAKCWKKWYENNLKPFTDDNKVTILWDFTIYNDRHIKDDKSDIVMKGNN